VLGLAAGAADGGLALVAGAAVAADPEQAAIAMVAAMAIAPKRRFPMVNGVPPQWAPRQGHPDHCLAT